MGYMGLGMQRWISTMKPPNFLVKEASPMEVVLIATLTATLTIITT